MKDWLELAQGPLFALSFLVMVLGLGRHVLLQVHALARKSGPRLRLVPWRTLASDSLGWAVPFRHLIRGTIVMSAASFLFHLGAVLVPLFFEGHVVRWEAFLGVALPAIPRIAADALTLLAIGCLLTLVGYRTFVQRARDLSRASDYLLLLLILTVFVSGYLALHPAANPLPWQTMMLIHVLSADCLLVAVPFTKLSHVVLFFFDQLSPVHWKFRPGSGDRVAEALFGKEARV